MELLGLPLTWPIVGAPMAGGPSTPALVSAVSGAGGLGFLAAGYRSAAMVAADIDAVTASTTAPFGVNLFVPQPRTEDRAAIDHYLEQLRPEADRFGVDLPATWDDDAWDAKLEVVEGRRVPVVSFTFGCPPSEVVRRLHDVGSRVLVTVTSPDEARAAVTVGADAVGAQGREAGGHQGTFTDHVDLNDGWSVLDLVTAVGAAVDVPVVAAGGIMDGGALAGVVRVGAVAGQLGTAFLRSDESGATPMYRAALVDPAFDRTAFTRAFSGRRARGLVNRFMGDHPDAPVGYPEINNATRPLRSAATRRGDNQAVNLWAGTGYRAATVGPAAAIVRRIGREFEAAVAATGTV
jgi:nitronate monooxygenase